jgi:superfamily II DNA or RNA helicase
MTVTLHPHQQEALRQLKDGSILWGGVGTGKTIVALAYYEQEQLKRQGEAQRLVVITTAKKRDTLDWQTEAAKFAIGDAPHASWYGVMVVDSWNNLYKYTDVEDAFFIFDEQRLVGSGEWVKSFLKIARNNNWILLTATPGDTWLDYIPVFVANGFYKNRTAFKREHVVYSSYTKFPKVDRYLNVQKLVKHRHQILVRMPYEKQTTRHEIDVWVDHDPELLRRVEEDLWNPFKERPIRDVAEKFYVMRQVTNSDLSRLEALRGLLDKHRKLIVFYNFNYELAVLRSLKGELGYAEWNGHKHQEIPQDDRWVYVIQYSSGAEGWNCVETDAIAFWSLTYSYKLWEQAHGRIDRLNSPFFDLWYYTLRSRARIDEAILRALKTKKSFQNKYYA